MRSKWAIVVLISIFSFTGCTTLKASRESVPETGLKVAGVFSDNMVLQRDIIIPVWGWAKPGKRVVVSMEGQEANAIADKAGKWRAYLPSMKAGGPYTLTVSGDNKVSFSNVLIGDVWLCSGQSNMAMNMRPGPLAVYNVEQEIAAANYPTIRLFNVLSRTSLAPKHDLDNVKWQVCDPTTVPDTSAVGYFFGRELSKHLNVPIGLINSSFGGSAAEAWTSPEALRALPDYTKVIDEYPDRVRRNAIETPKYAKRLAKWEANLDSLDAGYKKGKPIWAAPTCDDKAWTAMTLPCNWEDAGYPTFDGFMWFRKEVEVPASWAEKDLKLGLGTINDMDRAFFNGVEVGRFEQREGWTRPRVYDVPAKLVKTGRNVITVRVYDVGGRGGICGTATDMWLKLASGDPALVTLAGPWRCMQGLDLQAAPKKPEEPVFKEGNSHLPTAIYNAMILPILPYGIRGAIWYQGESNADRAYQYRTLFPAMIQDWRTRWSLGDFPFFFVQLASFYPVDPKPVESTWAELREAQTMTLAQPNTGMAVTIDIGDAGNIHPRNKQDVGRRLSLWALHDVYGESLAFSGPLYSKMILEQGKIRLNFSHVEGGLVAKGGILKGFAVAGEDHKFVWADARIEGETVVVSSPGVPNPVSVRYAWANNPECNLFNGAGLPASPFRTDTWPGITDGKH